MIPVEFGTSLNCARPNCVRTRAAIPPRSPSRRGARRHLARRAGGKGRIAIRRPSGGRCLILLRSPGFVGFFTCGGPALLLGLMTSHSHTRRSDHSWRIHCLVGHRQVGVSTRKGRKRMIPTQDLFEPGGAQRAESQTAPADTSRRAWPRPELRKSPLRDDARSVRLSPIGPPRRARRLSNMAIWSMAFVRAWVR